MNAEEKMAAAYEIYEAAKREKDASKVGFEKEPDLDAV